MDGTAAQRKIDEQNSGDRCKNLEIPEQKTTGRHDPISRLWRLSPKFGDREIKDPGEPDRRYRVYTSGGAGLEHDPPAAPLDFRTPGNHFFLDMQDI